MISCWFLPQNYKNNTTFINKTFLGSLMKVTLFLIFCHFLMVKIKSEKAVLCGSGDQQVLGQINWDQNFWVLFGDILPLCDQIWHTVLILWLG